MTKKQRTILIHQGLTKSWIFRLRIHLHGFRTAAQILRRRSAQRSLFRIALRAQLRLPPHVPRPGEELLHSLHRDALCFRGPEAEDHEANEADACPEDVRAPDVEAVEHGWRGTHDGKLEEPVYRHVSCVADASYSRGQDLSAVQVLDGTQSDRPANSIDEHRCNGGIGRGLVLRVDPNAHIDSHVYVCGALEEQAAHEADAPTNDVDEAPRENHGEEELERSISARVDQRYIVTADTSISENGGDVVCDSVTARPLGNRLHRKAQEKPLAIGGNGGNFFYKLPRRSVGQSLFRVPCLLNDLGIFSFNGWVVRRRSS